MGKRSWEKVTAIFTESLGIRVLRECVRDISLSVSPTGVGSRVPVSALQEHYASKFSQISRVSNLFSTKEFLDLLVHHCCND